MIRAGTSDLVDKFQTYRVWKQAERDVRKNGFWFVDIPRTSSSSLRTELAAKYGSNYGKGSLFDRTYTVSRSVPAHIPAVRARRRTGERLWDNSFTFSMVRNPWDRFLSIYWYARKAGVLPESFTFRDCVKQFRSPRYLRHYFIHSDYAFYYSAWEYL